jgi:hypothetical protein
MKPRDYYRELIAQQIKELKSESVLDIRPTGSRSYVTPCPLDTDDDYIVLVTPKYYKQRHNSFCLNTLNIITHLNNGGYADGGADGFRSYKMDYDRRPFNFIVTKNPEFFQSYVAATEMMQGLNYSHKETRVKAFRDFRDAYLLGHDLEQVKSVLIEQVGTECHEDPSGVITVQATVAYGMGLGDYIWDDAAETVYDFGNPLTPQENMIGPDPVPIEAADPPDPYAELVRLGDAIGRERAQEGHARYIVSTTPPYNMIQRDPYQMAFTPAVVDRARRRFFDTRNIGPTPHPQPLLRNPL